MDSNFLSLVQVIASIIAVLSTIVAGYFAYLAAKRSADASEILALIESRKYNSVKRKYGMGIFITNDGGIITVDVSISNSSEKELAIGFAIRKPSDDELLAPIFQKTLKKEIVPAYSSMSINLMKEINKSFFKSHPHLEVISINPTGKVELVISRSTDFIIELPVGMHQLMGHKPFEE